MSDYGKLWEQVANIRNSVKVAMCTPNVSNSLAQLKSFRAEIESLIRRWEALEVEMEKCDPQSGNVDPREPWRSIAAKVRAACDAEPDTDKAARGRKLADEIEAQLAARLRRVQDGLHCSSRHPSRRGDHRSLRRRNSALRGARMNNDVKFEDLSRVYARLSPIVEDVAKAEAVKDVVAGLFLVALLMERTLPWTDPSQRRQATLDLVAKLYDIAHKEQGDQHAAL